MPDILDKFLKRNTPTATAGTVARLEARLVEQAAAFDTARNKFAEAALAVEDGADPKTLNKAAADLDKANNNLRTTEAAIVLARHRHQEALQAVAAEDAILRREAAEKAAIARLEAARKIEEAVDHLAEGFFAAVKASETMRVSVSDKTDINAAILSAADMERAISIQLVRAGLTSILPIAKAIGATNTTLAQRIESANTYALGQP